MRYFLDTEFLEDGTTIVLISLGVVAEDGREMYLEADLEPVDLQRVLEHEWLMANVWPYLTGNSVSKSQIAREFRSFTIGHDPEFWGYCSAYDWVVINQLYGPMIMHPTKWPFYCNDIAQYARYLGVDRRNLPKQTDAKHNALNDARWTRDVWQALHHYDMERRLRRHE